jgi:hypothetical protein
MLSHPSVCKASLGMHIGHTLTQVFVQRDSDGVISYYLDNRVCDICREIAYGCERHT